MNGTRTPTRTLPPDVYVCGRCGRECRTNVSRPRPVMCRDCREVEAKG